MAEKRLKDRLALKLLGIHGTGGLYSEDEVDDAGERAPPAEDAIEKAYLHMINTMCTNRKQAEAFYKSNRGMIENLRKMTRDRVMDLLATISRQEVA
jgi:hypothetical protein